jgi:hypothetical protein
METYPITLSNGFTLYEAINFQSTLNLIDEIRNLITSNYNDTTTLLNRELIHNKQIIFIRDADGKLASFFMTNFDIINNEVISYMGLMAVSDEYKSMNLTAPMVIRYIRNLKRKERELGQHIISWATTATICSYRCLTAFCDDYQPKEDGSFTIQGKKTAKKIVQYYKLNYSEENPFVLKRIAKGTAYSNTERERIRNIIKHKKFKLFKRFGIEEELGDRILLLGFNVSEEKYNRWIAKFGIGSGIAAIN